MVVVIAGTVAVFAVDVDGAGAALTAFGIDLPAGRRTRHAIDKDLGQRGESVQLEGGLGNLIAILAQMQGNALQRNTGLVVGHIHTAAAAVLARGQGERVLHVFVRVRYLAVLGLYGVFAVGQDREVQPDGIGHKEGIVRILYLPGLDALVVGIQGNAGAFQVAQQHFYFLSGEIHPQLFVREAADQVLGIGAAGQKGFGVPLAGLPLLLQGQCIGIQGFILGPLAAFLFGQFAVADAQQVASGIDGEGLPGILVGQFLIGFPLLFALINGPVLLSQLIIGQYGLVGIHAREFLFQHLRDIVSHSITAA